MMAPLSENWLTAVLASLGSTGDEVARTLRKAGATGTPADLWNDPVGNYLRAQARDLLPQDVRVEILVSSDDVVVTIAADVPGDSCEITASTPGPVEDFLDRFDAGQDYQDLAQATAAPAVPPSALAI